MEHEKEGGGDRAEDGKHLEVTPDGGGTGKHNMDPVVNGGNGSGHIESSGNVDPAGNGGNRVDHGEMERDKILDSTRSGEKGSGYVELKEVEEVRDSLGLVVAEEAKDGFGLKVAK